MNKNQRFGPIVSSVNVAIEPEYYSINLKGVSFYTSRVLSKICTPEELQKMGGYVGKSCFRIINSLCWCYFICLYIW